MARIVVIAGTDAGYKVADVLRAAGHEVTREPSMDAALGGAELLFVESWLYATPAAPAEAPVVIIAPPDALGAAVHAVQRGHAYDLLRVPSTADEMRLTANRALRYRHLLRENAAFRAEVELCRSAAATALPAGVPIGVADQPAGESVLTHAREWAGKPLADIEKQVILSTLEQFQGHRLKTASALGIGVRTLGMKIKRWRDEGETIAGRQKRHGHQPVPLDIS